MSRALIVTVKLLRKAQRDYFATRTTDALQEARRLERLVDEMLARYNEAGDDLGAQQELF